MRVAGIDPGTKSFDIVLLEEDSVSWEKSIDTLEIVRDPTILTTELERLQADVVVAPSGYGIPLDNGLNVKDPRKLVVEVILLTAHSDLMSFEKRDEIGAGVYKGLMDVTISLVKKMKDRVVFIPGVIHLPTIPWYRKVNKVDMGTADKLASTFLAVYEISYLKGIDYDDVNLILVELGFGYNAVIAVSDGKIVDGIGGTYASIGTLTAGSMDLEVVAGSKVWSRWDVAHGGILDITGLYDIEEFLRRSEQGEEPYASLYNAYIEGIIKDINRAKVSVPDADIIVLTGRFSRVRKIFKHIREKINDMEVLNLRGLKGAVISKESAQGYVAIGAGLYNGAFTKLLKHMEIDRSCGTSVDYVYHPRGLEFARRVKKAYIESVYSPKLCSNT